MMIVQVDEIERVNLYLESINNAELEEIVWMRGYEKINVTNEQINQYKYTGLRNSDFPFIVGSGIKIAAKDSKCTTQN